MNRKEALQAGSSFFYGKAPCKNNHNRLLRYTSTGNCVDCVKLRNKTIAENRQQHDAADRAGFVLLNIEVHKMAYDSIVEFIKATHRILGLPLDAHIVPAIVPSNVGLPTEWANNPFARAPACLPMAQIESDLRRYHQRGQFMDVTLETLKGRHWTNLPKSTDNG